jgi:hypothetical protein
MTGIVAGGSGACEGRGAGVQMFTTEGTEATEGTEGREAFFRRGEEFFATDGKSDEHR